MKENNIYKEIVEGYKELPFKLKGFKKTTEIRKWDIVFYVNSKGEKNIGIVRQSESGKGFLYRRFEIINEKDKFNYIGESSIERSISLYMKNSFKKELDKYLYLRREVICEFIKDIKKNYPQCFI